MKKTYKYTESKILKQIGNNIRKARLEKGLSMFELARQSRVHQATIKKIEEGTSNSSIMVLETLTKILSIHISV